MPLPSFVVNTQGLVVRDGRYLMIVRSEDEDHAPGVLSPPGGKAELGDDALGVLEETLRREILEEIGVTVGQMAYLRSSRFWLGGGRTDTDGWRGCYRLRWQQLGRGWCWWRRCRCGGCLR